MSESTGPAYAEGTQPRMYTNDRMMKPSEMSRDLLLAEWLMLFAHEMFGGLNTPPEFDEIAARLRNSIPKPVVEVKEMVEDANGQYVDDVVFLNGKILDELDGELFANQLRTALGITDTEGDTA